ncbi:chorismate mutase [Streptomyces roseirectus]|uniref:chorismate mutase n=1 Tax=Streptomyces roseirectus TaxID=2768066 RepID=A0A7H0IAQ5_9ACTN|nr:chorismate mutase [Streptomyces roseirectus]QNP69871.1 chorismate mutase [Streptomyces roseirectus]
MHNTTPTRRALTTLAVAAAVALGATGTAVAAPATQAASRTATADTATADAPTLHTIADLAAQRLATADLVAAAKFGTSSPIDDPAREQQVLDTVAAQAQQLGADPDAVRAVFRDQIEANKLVQRALFQRWTDHPDEAPTTRPDLSVVRVEINRINTELVKALAATADDRASFLCYPELAVSAAQVRHERHLDRLHTKALVRALPSVCES